MARIDGWRRWLVLALFLVLVATAVACWRYWSSRTGNRTFAHQDVADEEPVAPNPGYLGPAACAACHQDRVAEFAKTTHYRACRPPRIGEVPAGFGPGQGEYRARNPALRFVTTESGGRFTQTAIRATAASDERSEAQIDLLYGNGFGDQIYFTFQGDRLFELPVGWLFPMNRWAEKPFDPQSSGNCLRTTNPRCLECHNTWVGHVAGSSNEYRRDTMILGVTCEKCHGPGREHVAFHQAHGDAKSGHDIVHPGRLSRDRQIDVCGQCHSNAFKRRGPAFSYRPGEPLDAFFRTSINNNQENDHVADQVKYLKQSKCFQHSDTLTCVTCHNPHRAPAPVAPGGGSCQKCHQPADCHERPRLPAGVRDQCVNCHMPRFLRIQVVFHTPEDSYFSPVRPRQHRIGIYSFATREVLLNWHRGQAGEQNRTEAARLAKELDQHWQGEAEKFRREYRFMAAIAALREAQRIDPSPDTRAKLDEVIAIQTKLDDYWPEAIHLIGQGRIPEAAEKLDKILALKPDHAGAHYRLGMIYADAQQPERAMHHLQAAAKADPDDDGAELMLGWLAYLSAKPEQAIEHYRRADAISPYNSKIQHLWGIALGALGKWPEALERFRLVVKIDPNHANGCLSLSKALRQQGQAAEAVRYAQKAVRLTRFEDIDALLTLADIYLDLSRFAEADDVIARAVAAAGKGGPQMNSELSWRLVQVRSRASRSAPSAPDS
jgi:tetratricopeptide (TPR) repeat protein